jgi:hypothetical protein
VSLKALRVIVMAICIAGIGGMVAGSIADNNGAAVTSGLIAAVAVLVLMAATVAARSSSSPVDEERASRIEERITALIEAGASEAEVRALVADAVRLGRGS